MAQVKNNMVHGVAPVLQALRQLEPEMYKQIVDQLKTDTNDLRLAVAGSFPDKPWQSSTGVINWTRYGRKKRGRKTKGEGGASFPKWEAGKVKRGVTVQVGGRKIRRKNEYPILRVKQSDAAGAIYDLANKSDSDAGAKFVSNLQGDPSRVMWPSVKRFYPLVQTKVERTLDVIGKRFTHEIALSTERSNAQSIRAMKQSRNILGQFK
jgi:hypothetical protein